ncbi:glycosyltransferase [Candidatus Omnitrophota bacterium]
MSNQIKTEKKTETLCAAFLFVGKGIVAPYIIEDIALALKQLQCDVTLVPLNIDQNELASLISSSKPQFVVALDGKGLDYAPIASSNILRVAWFVDNPFYFKELKTLQSQDVVFVWDREYIPDLKKAGLKNAFFLPLATNPQRFNDEPLSQEDRETYSCEVSFVGTVGQPQEYFRNNRKKTYPAEINNLVDKMIPLVLQSYDIKKYGYVLKGVRNVEDNLDGKVKSLIQFLVDTEVNAIKRYELIKSLSSFKTTIYGDIQTQETCDTAKIAKRPVVDYRSELSKVFKASTINLNSTRPQLKTTVNQRIFDVFSSGGFLLTDYRAYLDEIIPFSSDLISFSNPHDLKDKITYYLKHEDERSELIIAAQKTVRHHHTYLHRIEELMHVIKPMLQN